jgi:hypothetical protein
MKLSSHNTRETGHVHFGMWLLIRKARVILVKQARLQDKRENTILDCIEKATRNEVLRL